MIMPAAVDLPSTLAADMLADACREIAVDARVQPLVVEKDYYLTRLIWGLAQRTGAGALLKGGTLLSKVDLGFHRMSEDVDLVVPGTATNAKRANALQMNAIRAALQHVAPLAGLRLKFPHGERSDRDAHVRWELPYESVFGDQFILVEATIRPVLLPIRRAPLRQLLPMAEIAGAYCWALDELEARAEKVRAAFTRREPRDYYDLQLLASAGKDLSSAEFLSVVDRKLAELGALPLAKQPAAFGLSNAERAKFDRSARAELATVVRVGESPFDLGAMIAHFNALWGKAGSG
jgi:predicted nucleotidyltransferase component of viral defense system